MIDMRYAQLYELARQRRQAFREAVPFPHAVFDDFLDEQAYRFFEEAFPSLDDRLWKKPENAHTKGKRVTRRGPDDLKEAEYSESVRRGFMELNSGMFLRFLTILSGIDDITADPYFAEGGFHCSESGGFLDIHADFSHHDQLGLERRLNLLFYLNAGWKPEYEGALSLYDTTLNPVQTILPIANRCVVFETSETSYHGHPEPMVLPDGVYRRSIALYYYSLPRPTRAKSTVVFPSDRTFVPTPTRD